MMKLSFADLAKGVTPDVGITVYDEVGKAVKLGPEQQLGRTGASGSVYTLPCAPDFCVKLYRKEELASPKKLAQTVNRLRAMLKLGVAADPRFCWPLGLVTDKPGGKGKVVGFGMRRLPEGCKPVKLLFGGAAAVQRVWPGAGRRELATLAANLVDAVIALEAWNVEPADFNPENFVFDNAGHVFLLDLDSVSFREGGTAYPSKMCYGDTAAPELLGKPDAFKELRSRAQTVFSMAVLCFQVVQLGEHPFSFVEVPGGPRMSSPAENIRAGLCALGGGTGLQRAPRYYALWSWLVSDLQSVFLRIFRHEGYADPARRPTLHELSFALRKFAFECGRTPERNKLEPDGPKNPRLESGAPSRPADGGLLPAFATPALPIRGGRRPGRMDGTHEWANPNPGFQAYHSFR